MQEMLAFLKANRTVFLATSDKGEARVRPFQFQFAVGGRLWFCTSKKKEVYAQLKADPRLEFSATAADTTTIRVKGRANMDDDMAVKTRILKESASIRGMYGSPDNPDFAVFSVDHGSAYLFDLKGTAPRTVRF